MAIIYIKDLIIEANHGVHQHEKQNLQRFRVSVKLTVNTDNAGGSDDLSDTIDWSELRHKIIKTVQDNSFNLMERLAQEIAKQVLVDQRVQKITVAIEKLDAFPDSIPGIEFEATQV